VQRRTPSTGTVLRALAGQPAEWRHGYAIMKQTGIRSGTLYPILQRLAESGLLDARWEEPVTSGRPARHLYRLTGAGLERARHLEADHSTSPTGVRFRMGGAT
jgi:DNA-binding PadR family transcriptional regulator